MKKCTGQYFSSEALQAWMGKITHTHIHTLYLLIMNMLLLKFNLRQPGMVERYIKDSCARVKVSLSYIMVGWFMPKKFPIEI